MDPDEEEIGNSTAANSVLEEQIGAFSINQNEEVYPPVEVESPSTKEMRDFITEHFDGIGLQ